jgi:hypothetical protein
MRIIHIIPIFLMLLAVGQLAFAQSNPLIPYRQGALWGYCDTAGKIKIKPAYDKVDFFAEYNGYAKVYLKGKIAYINKAGTFWVSFFDAMEFKANGVVIVTNGNLKGIWYNGKLTAAVKYDTITYENIRPVAANAPIYAMGKKGKNEYRIDCKTGAACLFKLKKVTYYQATSRTGTVEAENKERMVAAPVGDRGTGVVEMPSSNTGQSPEEKMADSLKRVLQIDLAALRYVYKKGVATKYFLLYKNRQMGYWRNGALVMPAYQRLEPLFYGDNIWLLVQKGNRWGAIREDGRTVLPFEYSDIELLANNTYRTMWQYKYGLLQPLANPPIIANQYSSLALANTFYLNNDWTQPYFSIYTVTLNGKNGYMGENGVLYFKD